MKLNEITTVKQLICSRSTSNLIIVGYLFNNSRTRDQAWWDFLERNESVVYRDVYVIENWNYRLCWRRCWIACHQFKTNWQHRPNIPGSWPSSENFQILKCFRERIHLNNLSDNNNNNNNNENNYKINNNNNKYLSLLIINDEIWFSFHRNNQLFDV